MKKRKRSLLQRMMAVLLSAVLVTGMVSNAVPMTVLAQESGETLESVSGDSVGTVGENIESEKETDSDKQKDTEITEGEEETVTEEPDGETGNLQALLERIAALPDAEEYLAMEPDVDSGETDEDAYEKWLAGLYAYVEEAIAIQEEIEELSEEEQAEIPEEELQKLAAWVAAAQTAEESAQVMAAESSIVMAAAEGTSGTCGNGLTWTLADGVLTISGSGDISDFAFDKKSDIKTVVINDGVTSIGVYTFRDCGSLTSITIPASVTSIATCAFYNCGSLTSITISEGVESIGGNAFYNCSSLTSITIPASVESIGSNAFHKCNNLTNVELLGELTAIAGGTFWECSSLTSITIPAGVTSIGNSAFKGCSSLTSITIPAGVTSIGQSAFDSCSSLTSITIPEKVTSIGGAAFWDCSKLAEVIMKGTTPPSLGNNVFSNCECIKGSTKGIHVPVGTVDTYKQATGWSGYKNNITDGTHTHSWLSAWTTNETHHWHNCTVQDCPTTDNAAKGGYGEHVYDNDSDTTCNTCGYKRTVEITGIAMDLDLASMRAAQVGDELEAPLSNITFSPAVGKRYNYWWQRKESNGFTKYENSEWEEGIYVYEVELTPYNGMIFASDLQITSSTGEHWTVVERSDDNRTIVLRSDEIVKTAHTHNYGDWQHNDTQHWKVCSCGDETGRGNHDFGDWVTDREATAAEAGTKHRICHICQYKVTEIISATGGGNQGGSGSDGSNDENNGSAGGNSGSASGGAGDSSSGGESVGNSGGTGATAPTSGSSGTGQSKVKQEKEGNIRKEVSVTGESTLDAAVETPLSKLADSVLTETEKQQAAAGTDIRLVLDVKDAASAIVSAADKTLVEAALNGSLAQGYTLGQYLDISLYKVIGNSRNIIKETNGKITVAITVPDSLKNTDSSKTRAFAVIRVHDGKAERLDDLDDSAETITIETDRFSTYAIVYKDSSNNGNDGNGDNNGGGNNGTKPESAKDSEPKTGDATPIELYATLAMIEGFAYLLLYFTDRQRGMTEETKKELVSRLIRWAKQGGKIRKYLALAAIFVLLVYYHSIGKKTCVEWKEIYGE